MKKKLVKFREWKVTRGCQGGKGKGKFIYLVLISASHSYEGTDPLHTDVTFQVSSFYSSFLEISSKQKTSTK